MHMRWHVQMYMVIEGGKLGAALLTVHLAFGHKRANESCAHRMLRT